MIEIEGSERGGVEGWRDVAFIWRRGSQIRNVA